MFCARQRRQISRHFLFLFSPLLGLCVTCNERPSRESRFERIEFVVRIIIINDLSATAAKAKPASWTAVTAALPSPPTPPPQQQQQWERFCGIVLLFCSSICHFISSSNFGLEHYVFCIVMIWVHSSWCTHESSMNQSTQRKENKRRIKRRFEDECAMQSVSTMTK